MAASILANACLLVVVAACLVAAVPVHVTTATTTTATTTATVSTITTTTTTITATASTTITRSTTVTVAPCSTHGEPDSKGVCHCEVGFAGANCELVIVTGQMLYPENHPVENCKVKVYGTDDINADENLLGEGTCNPKGMYSVTVPYRSRYVVSGKNHRGTEARQFFFVPHTKEHRDAKNTRARRSHLSNWKNPHLLLPGAMTGEMWYAHIFWGWDHTAATCNLNLNVHTPYPLPQYGYVNGCTADTWYNQYMCEGTVNPDEHNAEPYTSDVSCNSNQYGYGYENFYIYEESAGINFEIFTYNPDLQNANYDQFRNPNLMTAPGGQGVFALAALYNADATGWAQLLSTIDITKSSQSYLGTGLYWHLWSLQVNTIPSHVQNFTAGTGNFTVHNVVSCSPQNMVYSNAIQPWEPTMNQYYRGNSCGKQF